MTESEAKTMAEAWRRANPGLMAAWDGAAKSSKCCEGEKLVPMHSTNTKICTGCKSEIPWPLEPGQVPTLTKELKQ